MKQTCIDRLTLLGLALAGTLMVASCGGKHDSATADIDKPATASVSEASTEMSLPSEKEVLEQDGIRVNIDAIHRRKDVKARFGTDLVKKGFMPVQLQIMNESYDGTIKISPEDVYLVDPEGKRIHGAAADYIFSKVKRSYGESVAMGVLFGGLGALASAASVASENEDLEAAIVGDALHEKLIAPGESCKGVVYFPVPEELYLLDGWRIEVAVNNPGHKKFYFGRPLSGKTDYRGRKPLYLLKKELAAKKAKTQ